MHSHWNQRYFENGVKFAYLDITKSEFTILPNVQVICKKKTQPFLKMYKLNAIQGK